MNEKQHICPRNANKVEKFPFYLIPRNILGYIRGPNLHVSLLAKSRFKQLCLMATTLAATTFPSVFYVKLRTRLNFDGAFFLKLVRFADVISVELMLKKTSSLFNSRS